MDANTQNTIRVHFSAYVDRLDAAARLVAEHGFAVNGATSNYLDKEADTTFADALLYCGSMRGVPGVLYMGMNVVENPDVGVKTGP